MAAAARALAGDRPPVGLDAELVPATQTVYHDAAHPSHVVLPPVE